MKNLFYAQSWSPEDFSYELPETKIPAHPIEKRDESKLLIYRNGQISEDLFKQITSYIPRNSFLVFNNTRVIYARLSFKKSTGASIEIFCLSPEDPSEFSQVFQQTGYTIWNCIIGNLKKWKDNPLQMVIKLPHGECKLYATLKKTGTSTHTVLFEWDPPEIQFADILQYAGKIPIPPYLKRESKEIDKTRYQTVYSKHKGSVAAPTAGLHFTKETFENLKQTNIGTGELTLHVSAGTFQPIKSQKVGDHDMHTEHFSVSRAFIRNLTKYLPSIISVGTTTLRALESLYWLGIKIHQISSENDLFINQWEPYESTQEIPTQKALNNLIEYLDNNKKEYISAKTQIMIVPGYQFKCVAGLITNFHQPKSSLLMLVAAFVGEDWERIYSYALQNDFRFLSYGDSSILLPYFSSI